MRSKTRAWLNIKLRTLVTYLEIMAELHGKYSSKSSDELSRIEVPEADN